jgi:hypothetical protein
MQSRVWLNRVLHVGRGNGRRVIHGTMLCHHAQTDSKASDTKLVADLLPNIELALRTIEQGDVFFLE